jgi:hypothetical protein
MLFLSGRTPFNSDLFEAEHLMIEDETIGVGHHQRSALAAQIKSVVANQVHACHKKGRQIVNLRPWCRLSITLNDDPERLRVLPDLTDDFQDKIIVLRAMQFPMPKSTNTPEEKERFREQLAGDIPAYLHWLNTEFVVPEAICCPRFGVRAWHHPALVEEVNALGPAAVLLGLIDQSDIFQWSSEWTGTALELRSLLLENERTLRDARKLLDWTNACGQYLKESSKNYPERVRESRRASKRMWIVMKPREEDQ